MLISQYSVGFRTKALPDNNKNQTDLISANSSNLQNLSKFNLPSGNSAIISYAKSVITFGLTPKKFDETLGYFDPKHPDKYQLESAKNLYEGKNNVVSAPTGTGKTLIAEYVIKKNMSENKKTYYTVPLKALCNQKYFDFCKEYGAENVGIATGDVKHNVHAPIVVMTAEIYRNALVSAQDEDINKDLKNVKTVVMDEFHTMNDPERGTVYEETIMFNPKHIQLLPLSATMGNAQILTNWIGETSGVSTALVDVPESERHVPLIYNVYKDGKIKNLFYDKINYSKLKEDLKDNKLSDRQKLALTELAKAYGKEATPENGLKSISLRIKDASTEALVVGLSQQKNFLKRMLHQLLRF